jgi:heme-degrading monooxygenase HmoA
LALATWEDDADARKGGAMEDEYVVWITTRRLKPGTHEEFIKAWKPREFPEGMIRAYECYTADRQEVVGISVWDSLESRERFRLSESESERRRAMAPFVIDESSGIYVGRELRIPTNA